MCSRFPSALENCPLSELIQIDDTYLDRTQLRKTLMIEHPNETIQCNTPCESAVLELHDWIFKIYLPRRFPTMYKLLNPGHVPADHKVDGQCLYNIASHQCIPLRPSSALEALRILGEHVDTDFLILLPSSTAPDGSLIYHLQAFVTCFPSGFSTLGKLGLPLAGIHKPVPGYQAKLEKSMDRFFAKMELGKAVRRVNWSITTNDDLYSQAGNHMYADGGHKSPEAESSIQQPAAKNEKTLEVDSPDLQESIERQKEDVVIENCRLRCERQTLHRLARTKALVFAFKTYQYRLEDVKAEGSGLALADAVQGLGQGNTPEMKFYKRGVVWGDKVIAYLRS